MASTEREPRVSPVALGFIGHELGRALALHGSAAERLAFEARAIVRGADLDEATRRAAEIRIKTHLERIWEQRREVGTLLNAIPLLNTSEESAIELHFLQTSAKAVLARAVGDRDDLPLLVSGVDVKIVCDAHYLALGLRYLLETASRQRMHRPPEQIVVRIDQQQERVDLTFSQKTLPQPRGNDIRIDLARRVVAMHDGSISFGDMGSCVVSLPRHLKPGISCARLPPRGPNR